MFRLALSLRLMTSVNGQPSEGRLQRLLSQQPSHKTLVETAHESLRLLNTAKHPSAFLVIHSMAISLAGWLERNEPVPYEWVAMVTREVLPATRRVLATANSEHADADRVAAMDAAAWGCGRALTWEPG